MRGADVGAMLGRGIRALAGVLVVIALAFAWAATAEARVATQQGEIVRPVINEAVVDKMKNSRGEVVLLTTDPW